MEEGRGREREKERGGRKEADEREQEGGERRREEGPEKGERDGTDLRQFQIEWCVIVTHSTKKVDRFTNSLYRKTESVRECVCVCVCVCVCERDVLYLEPTFSSSSCVMNDGTVGFSVTHYEAVCSV